MLYTPGREAIAANVLAHVIPGSSRGCAVCGGPTPSARADYCRPAHRQKAYRLRHEQPARIGFCPFCGARVTVAQLLARRAPAVATGNVAVDMRRELAGKDRRGRLVRVLAGVAAAVLVLVVSGAVNSAAGLPSTGAAHVVSSGPASGELATWSVAGAGSPSGRVASQPRVGGPRSAPGGRR